MLWDLLYTDTKIDHNQKKEKNGRPGVWGRTKSVFFELNLSGAKREIKQFKNRSVPKVFNSMSWDENVVTGII
ncbi:hypothetical protein GGGNBK_15070 [Sporosarcina sp. ANT_H38]